MITCHYMGWRYIRETRSFTIAWEDTRLNSWFTLAYIHCWNIICYIGLWLTQKPNCFPKLACTLYFIYLHFLCLHYLLVYYISNSFQKSNTPLHSLIVYITHSHFSFLNLSPLLNHLVVFNISGSRVINRRGPNNLKFVIYTSTLCIR